MCRTKMNISQFSCCLFHGVHLIEDHSNANYFTVLKETREYVLKLVQQRVAHQRKGYLLCMANEGYIL